MSFDKDRKSIENTGHRILISRNVERKGGLTLEELLSLVIQKLRVVYQERWSRWNKTLDMFDVSDIKKTLKIRGSDQTSH